MDSDSDRENDSSIFDRSGEGGASENDPFSNAVSDAEESGVTPGFLGGNDWADGDYGKNNKKLRRNNDKKKNAASGLASAEKNASNAKLSGFNAKEKESSGGGFFSGSGKSKSKVKGGKKGWLKKGGPVGAILAAVLGIGGAISGMQLSQPFSLVAQFQETFNSMQVSTSTRSRSFLNYQLDDKRVKNPKRGTIFGKTLKVSKKQKEKLKQNGIEYDDDFNGKRVFKYDDGSGEIKVIAADKKTADSLGELDGVDPTTGKKYSKSVAVFDDIYSDNVDFHHAYNTGSMTWRGQIANWFGTRVAAFLTNNKLTRDMFNDYENKKASLDGDGLAAVKETLEEKTDTVENEGEKTKEVGDELDENASDEETAGGKKKYKSEESPENSGKMTRTETDLSKKMENIRSKFSASANIVCGVSNAIGAITLAVTAAETLQIINLATSYFEAVDKVKAGDGSGSPINELGTTLNEKKTSKYKEIESVSVDGDGTHEGDYKATIGESTSTKSAMESEGVAALYSGRKVSTSDPSVKSFNLTSSISKIMGGINSSMAAFQTCTIAKLAVSAVELVSAAADIIGCIAGLITIETGVGAAAALAECGKLVIDIGLSVGKNALIGAAIAGIMGAITPALTSAWTRDLVSNIGGEDLGNALTSGGNMYLGGAHRANGGSPATKDKYESYAVVQHQVMEDYAKYERESLSPFDVTSKNTFMGALTTQLMSFTTASSLMGVISSGSSAVSNSIIALSPSAAAYDVAKTLPGEDYESTCPYLASINVVGDAYCNPYVMTDMSTIGNDPADVLIGLEDQFEEEETSDGNVKIKGDSDLAKYVVYCDGRTSMFGAADYNIASSINSGTSANTGNTYTDAAVDGAIGAIPIVGDGIDIIENANSLSNIGYISGESCVAGNKVENASAPNWDRAKYYQRFIEDQSLAESMGIIDESAVTSYLREYYEENPLDNSYEGMIARYSGLDKETVTDIMAIAKYYEYVKQYNPSERYAFGAPAVEMEKELRFDNDNDVAGESVWGILADQISYADVRNRSFAV